MKKQTLPDRREKRRYPLPLTIHFRLTTDGITSRWGVGTAHDISSGGLSLRCRREFPIGGRLELIVEWPATQSGKYPISLHASGLILRSRGTRAAVQLTSHRFEVESHIAMPIGAIA
ncbi:MAG: PilZ domain-containing protein [Candidatus Solibacter sp.]